MRDAAAMLRQLEEPVTDVLARGGHEALIALPTIGRSLASAIEELVRRGRWSMLDRLRGEVSPEELFMTVPGIGEALAERIHGELGVDTLEDLEVAAHDGRLENVPGVGPRRAEAFRDLLAARLTRSRHRAHPQQTMTTGDPPVALLLQLDRRYREAAERGELKTIAPRRFNPAHEAWLPVWHTSEEGWHFTALFSNTALAHRLGKTHDWVVIYWERDGDERQATVVTEHRGALRGRRVVRGRERECLSHWARETERRLKEARYRRAG
ncbi:MAG: DNA-binding protein [Sandaracinaceae bacterium]|nr:DNA-binding protein [Sandaracinaceae bacterium]